MMDRSTSWILSVWSGNWRTAENRILPGYGNLSLLWNKKHRGVFRGVFCKESGQLDTGVGQMADEPDDIQNIHPSVVGHIQCFVVYLVALVKDVFHQRYDIRRVRYAVAAYIPGGGFGGLGPGGAAEFTDIGHLADFIQCRALGELSVIPPVFPEGEGFLGGAVAAGAGGFKGDDALVIGVTAVKCLGIRFSAVDAGVGRLAPIPEVTARLNGYNAVVVFMAGTNGKNDVPGLAETGTGNEKQKIDTLRNGCVGKRNTK